MLLLSIFTMLFISIAAPPTKAFAQTQQPSIIEQQEEQFKNNLFLSSPFGQPNATSSLFPFMSGNTTSISMVNGVSITTVNTTTTATNNENEIVVGLEYTGNGISPAITVITSAINFKSLELMISNMIQESVGESIDELRSNMSSIGEQNTSLLSLDNLPGILIGSNILEAGWQSPTNITVRLQENGTATTTALMDVDFISVQVVPFTG